MTFIYFLLIANVLFVISYKYTIQCKNRNSISSKKLDIDDDSNDSSINYNDDSNYDKYSYKDDSTRYVARVVYDGTKFYGWQEQTNKIRTVQGVLSSALCNRFSNKYPIKATGIHNCILS